MINLDEYLVPTQFGEDEFIEKKSRFIGRCWPVETEEEALEKIAANKAGIFKEGVACGQI